MSFFNHAFAKSFVAVVLVVLSLFAFNYASPAYAATRTKRLVEQTPTSRKFFVKALVGLLSTLEIMFPHGALVVEALCQLDSLTLQGLAQEITGEDLHLI
jgi:hypothetical protein